MTQDAQVFTPPHPTDFHPITRTPGMPGLFGKMICLSMVRSSGLSPDTALSNKGLVFRNRRIDPENLSRFKAVCGYDNDANNTEMVPAPYIQTLFIGIIGRFISSSDFPINPMGLIQVGQSFELKRPVMPETPLDLFCSLLDMSQTPKGIHSRFLLEARDGDNLVWEGISTYFTRAKNPPPKKKKDRAEEVPLTVRETITLPENTGRRYAGVSGDYNPHHLYAWTARFIGFKRAIAHGMWSLARACASLEKTFGHPEIYRIEGALKLPIFLPGTVTLGYETEDTQAEFELRDADKGLPHLKGRFISGVAENGQP
ncbi:MAG: hypothetical protein MI802_00505 [Desulfobacterales bacterium]|nr:hypothetical protein [Desulfobacterales bacterium]